MADTTRRRRERLAVAVLTIVLAVESLCHHTCAQNRLLRTTEDVMQTIDTTPSRRDAAQLGDTNDLHRPLSIRTYLDTAALCGTTLDETAACMCLSTTSYVISDEGTKRLCSHEDIVVPKDLALLKKVLASAVEFVGQTLSPVLGSTELKLARSCHRVLVPSCLRRGVQADFAMLVSLLPTTGGDDATGAWALPCQTDHYGRPVVGMVNVVPAHLKRYRAELGRAGEGTAKGVRVYRSLVMMIVHEFYHALGFTPYFWAGDKGLPMPGWFGDKKVLRSEGGVPHLASREVIRVAREHFGCVDANAIKGVPIEATGDSGSAGAHWEQTAMGDELMTPSILPDAVRSISAITLAFFVDSGHYYANYSVLDPSSPRFSWARGQCKATQTCTADMQCNAASSPPLRCSVDRSFVGNCTDDSFSECGSYQPLQLCAETLQSHNAMCVETSTTPLCATITCNNLTSSYTMTLGSNTATCTPANTNSVYLGKHLVKCEPASVICGALSSQDRWDGVERQLNADASYDEHAVPENTMGNTCVVQEKTTTNGCACLQVWSVKDSPEERCNDYCCSFTGEDAWCFVLDERCEGSTTGYCENSWDGVHRLRAFKTVLLVTGVLLIGMAVGVYFRQKAHRKAQESQVPPCVGVVDVPSVPVGGGTVVGVPVSGTPVPGGDYTCPPPQLCLHRLPDLDAASEEYEELELSQRDGEMDGALGV